MDLSLLVLNFPKIYLTYDKMTNQLKFSIISYNFQYSNLFGFNCYKSLKHYIFKYTFFIQGKCILVKKITSMYHINFKLSKYRNHVTDHNITLKHPHHYLHIKIETCKKNNNSSCHISNKINVKVKAPCKK